MHQLRGHRPNRLSINKGDVLTECRQRWAPPICVSINMGGGLTGTRPFNFQHFIFPSRMLFQFSTFQLPPICWQVENVEISRSWKLEMLKMLKSWASYRDNWNLGMSLYVYMYMYIYIYLGLTWGLTGADLSWRGADLCWVTWADLTWAATGKKSSKRVGFTFLISCLCKIEI